MKKTGYILLQIAGYLILFGGISDLIITFSIDSLPASHLNYLNIKNNTVFPELKNLDNAFMRAIGCCLIAVSIGALAIIYGPIRKEIKYTLPWLVGMVTIGEGGNALQMFLIDSPFFLFPLLCVIITWAGAIFWWGGNKKYRIK